MSIWDDWRAGVPYPELHVKHGPWVWCECDSCESKRHAEETEEPEPDEETESAANLAYRRWMAGS